MPLVHGRRLAWDSDNQPIEPDGPATGVTERSPDTAPGPAPAPRRALDALARLLVPAENPGASIYGLIVIGAMLAAESGRHETYQGTFAAALVATALYWLAHAYAGVLGRRLHGRERLSARAVLDGLGHDLPLIRGAAVPLLTLLLAAIAGAEQQTAVTAAIWSVVVSLVAFELLAGLRARAAPRELLIELAIGAAMGSAILAMKIILH